jgi:hypothetical protein
MASVLYGARARDAGACRWAAWKLAAASSGLLGHGDAAPHAGDFHFWRHSVGCGGCVGDGFCCSGSLVGLLACWLVLYSIKAAQ